MESEKRRWFTSWSAHSLELLSESQVQRVRQFNFHSPGYHSPVYCLQHHPPQQLVDAQRGARRPATSLTQCASFAARAMSRRAAEEARIASVILVAVAKHGRTNACRVGFFC